MLGLIGGVCIIASSSLAGISLSSRLRERYEVHKQLCEMFSLIKIYLQNEYLTADEILHRLSADTSADKLTFLKNAEVFSQAAENARSFTIIESSKRERLARYFSDFGKTDISGESAKTSLILREFELEASRLREKCDKYCRLYTALGVLAGAAVTVMMI